MEAIVAMVLVATTGMALFGWINTNIATLSRLHSVQAQDSATVNALQYLHGVNPALTPSGKVELGPNAIAWESEAVAPLRDAAGYPTGLGMYQVGIFRTKVSVFNPDGTAWFTFELQQPGYVRVRNIVAPF